MRSDLRAWADSDGPTCCVEHLKSDVRELLAERDEMATKLARARVVLVKADQDWLQTYQRLHRQVREAIGASLSDRVDSAGNLVPDSRPLRPE